MKKTLTSLLLIVLSFGLFAETGYNGLKWNIKKEILNQQKRLSTTEESSNIEIEERAILGTKTKIYYHIPAGELWAISYTIPKEKTHQLLKKYKKENLIIKTKTPSRTKNEILEDLKNEGDDLPADFDAFINEGYYLLVFSVEEEGIDYLINDTDSGKGILYIYDYNEDTRVYILENQIEGLTLVYYTYHEQDY